MHPKSYTTTPTGYKFHYDEQEYREWEDRGKEHGDVGPLLMEKDGNSMIFHLFGTIEHPFTEMYRLVIQHHPLFDGEWSLEKVMNPPTPWYLEPGALKLQIIDFGQD